MSQEAEIFAPTRPSRRGLVGVTLGALAVLGALTATGVVARAQKRDTLARETQPSGVPHVQVAKATRSTATGSRARSSRCKRPRSSPERTATCGSGTSLALAQTTNGRFAALAGKGVISQQEFDQYTTEVDVRQANIAAARASSTNASANIARVQELRGFGTIVAPFDGVITQRTAEIGQLVQAGTAQGQLLFKVAEDDVVRIFVNVPQLHAGGVKIGNEATVTVREAPGHAFKGRVARTSRSLDQAARALLVEVDVPNPNRSLVSGMYATIALPADRQDALLLIPSTADATGTRVAIVQNTRIHWQPVEIAADLGDRLAIASGLTEGTILATTRTNASWKG